MTPEESVAAAWADPEVNAAIVACLGDDAAALFQENEEDEVAQNMTDAIGLITRQAKAIQVKDAEMQAALERIADLKALLARARQSMYSFEPLALAVDTALAGKPERKAQDDGGYDLVAAWDRS